MDDTVKLPNWNTPEVHHAIDQGARDMGFDPDVQVVPWWAKTLLLDLYKAGWRRSPDGSFDYRDRKGLYQEKMVMDLENRIIKGRAMSAWLLQLATRLVESGWTKEI